MEKTEHRHLPWGPCAIAFFGLAFARAWLSLVFVGIAQNPSAQFVPLPHAIFDLAYIATALVVVLTARRLVPVSQKTWTFAGALGGMMAASLVFVLMPYISPAVQGWAASAAAVMGGVAFLVCTMLNCEMLAGVGLLRALIYISGNNLLGSVLAFFLTGTERTQVIIASLALPIVAIGCIHAACASIPPQDRQHAGYPRFEMPWKLFAVVAAFTFVYGMHQHELAGGAGRHSSFSTAIVAGIVFAVAYFFPQKLDLSRLWRAPLPIMVCGILLIPTEGLFGQVVSSYCISMGFTLMRFIVLLILLDMVKRTGAAIVPLAATNSFLQVCSLLGERGSQLLESTVGSAPASIASAVIACALLATAFFLIFSERELSSRWGVRVLAAGTSLEQDQDRESQLTSTCEYLVQTYHLTAREEEVLRALAKGKDTQAIAQDLMIAPGTLRAHTRHIYEKMGIHTRKELETLVGVAPGTANTEETR